MSWYILTYYTCMLLGECSLSCLHSGATCGIYHILAETNSVSCLQHSYQHVAPNS